MADLGDKKKCNGCGEIKLKTEFNKNCRAKDKLHYRCSTCRKATQAALHGSPIHKAIAVKQKSNPLKPVWIDEPKGDLKWAKEKCYPAVCQLNLHPHLDDIAQLYLISLARGRVSKPFQVAVDFIRATIGELEDSAKKTVMFETTTISVEGRSEPILDHIMAEANCRSDSIEWIIGRHPRLSKIERSIIFLFFEYGFDHSEIARCFDVSTEEVKAHIQTSLDVLRMGI